MIEYTVKIMYMYCSLLKEGPLWIIRPPPSFALISCWGLKLIRKSAHLVQALQTGISHCLASLARGCGETGLHTLQGANYTAA